jgi:hypothetical protein
LHKVYTCIDPLELLPWSLTFFCGGVIGGAMYRHTVASIFGHQPTPEAGF